VCATFYVLLLFTALLSPYLWKENCLDSGQASAFERIQSFEGSQQREGLVVPMRYFCSKNTNLSHVSMYRFLVSTCAHIYNNTYPTSPSLFKLCGLTYNQYFDKRKKTCPVYGAKYFISFLILFHM